MSDPLLVVEGLNAYYGPAHILQNVSFSVTEQAVAIIGRNGMGKSTLCAAIMGMTPPRTSGSVRFEGTELIGRASYKIAGLGIDTPGIDPGHDTDFTVQSKPAEGVLMCAWVTGCAKR